MLKDFEIKTLEKEYLPEMLQEITDAPKKYIIKVNFPHLIPKSFVLLALENILNTGKMFVRSLFQAFVDTIYV